MHANLSSCLRLILPTLLHCSFDIKQAELLDSILKLNSRCDHSAGSFLEIGYVVGVPNYRGINQPASPLPVAVP